MWTFCKLQNIFVFHFALYMS